MEMKDKVPAINAMLAGRHWRPDRSEEASKFCIDLRVGHVADGLMQSGIQHVQLLFSGPCHVDLRDVSEIDGHPGPILQFATQLAEQLEASAQLSSRAHGADQFARQHCLVIDLFALGHQLLHSGQQASSIRNLNGFFRLC
jgi:hypothetical protein